MQRLSGLVQERYGIAREDADKQVQQFLTSVDAGQREARDPAHSS
jgi:hypothetical protein